MMKVSKLVGVILALTSSNIFAGSVTCTITNNANVSFEQCKTNDQMFSWSKTSIEVGNKTYLNGQDKDGLSWSGVRESFGSESQTVYHDQQGKILTKRICKESECLKHLVSYYSNNGALSIEN
ncbi:hypothetical protein D1115_15510 [Vibrio alfacsensis]|uniref:C-type lysozyme inhibitor domain-containing protein n=1 Tax=Vibrio alfacsensis TaxID=1074311 RepID=A0ABN5PJR8_9VIBR|nr:hypothetical protein [Vibrio alfacsensis]AXY02471.1 hypothetical protein D1115_15510 [Vibrio alfacsensis]